MREAWQAEVWRVWPGSARLQWQGPGCFLGGFAMELDGAPRFLLISPVSPGSDAPAAEIAVLAAGKARVTACLEDVADCHLTPEGRALAGVEGTSFYVVEADGARSTLYEGPGLYGGDLLPGGQGMVLLEGDAQTGTLSLVVMSAAGRRVVAQGVADIPPEPEVGGRALAPCRVSPDGTKAAFAGTRRGSAGLFIVELGTGAVTVVPVQRPWGAVWAPDGAYVAVPGCGVFSAGGGSPVVPLGASEASVAWSNDGSHLLTGEAVIAVPQGTPFPLATLGLQLKAAAQVRPLGWVAGPAPGESTAFVVVSWREAE